MARYDYSLDVGKSIETDEKLKEKEEPKGCCNAPEPPEKSPGDEEQPVEEEQLENVPEEPKKKEPEKTPPSDDKVEIKPVSFEKAKLISDFEQKPEEDKKQEEPKEKEPEEDEKDINEFLEESFSKESKEYEEIQNKKNNKEVIIEEPGRKKRWLITAAVILIAILASAFGYIYFNEPTEPAGTAATPEVINITQVMQENTTNETVIEPVIEEAPRENASTEDILEDFTSALKD